MAQFSRGRLVKDQKVVGTAPCTLPLTGTTFFVGRGVQLVGGSSAGGW